MSAIYAIVAAAQRDDLNLAFAAMQYGPDTFSVELTDETPATWSSTTTHFHMYNAGANAQDFSDFAAAKAGTALPPDIYGNPVAWGVDGAISEVDAFAAFTGLQMWANDSDRLPADFALEQRVGLGLTVKPGPF